jgi:hypothetical protein
MPSDHFSSHFWQEGLKNIIPLPDCCICLAVSGDTHIDPIRRHMSIWPYGQNMAIWPYDYMASKVANMGVSGNSNKNAAIWRRN